MADALSVAAVMLGFASGVHCLAMCGGIVSAFGTQRPVRVRLKRRFRFQWLAPLVFNAGRIASYAVAGAAAGALGAGAGTLLGLSFDFRLAVQFATSLLLIVVGVHLAGVAGPLAAFEQLGRPLWRRIQPFAAKFMPFDTPGRAFAAGIAWGWLPCGLVYAALAIAVLAGGAAAGALVMFAFGLGTLPWLLAAGVGFARWREALRQPRWRLAIGALVLGWGVFGLARAASLAETLRGGAMCVL